MASGRIGNFRRNKQLEKLLSSLNKNLQPAEKQLAADYQHASEMKNPLILIMGPLRSGTTLFTQWLANTGLVSYPTNLLSRFYQAPIIGAKIQLLLTDPRYNFRDELGEFAQQTEYTSENGKTKGVLAPNEFWYFWRRFLAEPKRDVWTDDELRQSMDTTTMLAELAGIMDVFQKPFAAKGMLFNYNIPYLNSIIDKALFVQIKRDPLTNVASVLDARKRQLGDEAAWYSFKIPEYEMLKDLDPVTQVAGQIHYINKAVSRGLAKVDETRKLIVQYEDFCKNPKRIFAQFTEKIGMSNVIYHGPDSFKVPRTDDDILNKKEIEQALEIYGTESNNQ
ncbi:MAG TPA: sulfotransferase family protein [Mariniphaga anaerophila]|uniref:Sulfotransferase family protein n=1 Tax=Mariniphaga anaerophila TaxID=1484053 RepID=A0A831PJC0_9BACT|nr:sulfotransferase family protein [Mariniphaga anaerophila]